MTLVEDLVEDIADVTLIEEDTKSILLVWTLYLPDDDVNKEIPSNTTMYVAPPGGQISTNASGDLWWLKFQQLHVPPPVD